MNGLPELYPGWRTVRKIGSGGFGSVYEIERDLFDKVEKAALKVISIPQNQSDIDELYSSGYDDKSVTEHFRSYLESIVHEYSLMTEIKGHTNIVYCDDARYVQHDDGIGWDVFIKMELLTPLTKVLPDEVSDEMAVKVGCDLCAALNLCRSKNILHRDIKPQNIFVSDSGDCKLGDFGIAKTVERTSGGTRIGTYNYMAPEVYNNQPYGTAADLYSLGLVLYWMLNERRLPFQPLPPEIPTVAQNEEARAKRLKGYPLPAPKHGNAALKNIVLKACAFDPRDRFRSPQEMLDALTALQNGDRMRDEERTTVSTEPPEWNYPAYTSTPAYTSAPAYTSVPAYDPAYTPNSTPLYTSYPVQGDARGGESTPRGVSDIVSKLKWPVALAVILIAAAFILRNVFVHDWKSATCTQPEVCTLCGRERGEALGHSWQSATCTEPEFCAVCGEKRGEALGHDWQEATYSSPMFCARCGAVSGEPLPTVSEERDSTGKLLRRVEYFTDGRIRTLYEQGKNGAVEWEYVYDAQGYFIYRKRVIETVSLSWSRDGINGTNMQYSIPAMELVNCIGFTYDFEITVVTGGTARGDRTLLILNERNEWETVSEFAYPDYKKVSINVTLDEPVTVKGIGSLRSGPTSPQYDCEVSLRNVTLVDYNY